MKTNVDERGADDEDILKRAEELLKEILKHRLSMLRHMERRFDIWRINHGYF